MWVSLLLGALLVCGCASSRGRDPFEAAGGSAGQPALESAWAPAEPMPATVELGVPGGADGLDFIPLEPGTVLKLQTFGQGGTHVLVAVRCTGFGNRAFVSAKLQNQLTGVEVPEPAPARPQLLYCDAERVCDLVPYLVHASGLTETDEEKDGLPVLLSARVENEKGVMAEGSVAAVLSTADL